MNASTWLLLRSRIITSPPLLSLPDVVLLQFRTMALPSENATKERCEHGHPLTGENLVLVQRSDRGVERVCRTCARARSRAFHRRHYVPHPREPQPKLPPKSPPEPKPLVERVIEKLDMSATCWIWTGATTNGYGVVQKGRRGEGVVRVHRVVFEMFVGPIPDGLDVMHSCHNRLCANPVHLSVGTRKENMAQSQRDGRLRRTQPPT